MALGNSNLLVVEYDGMAESGRKTVVRHLSETRGRVAADETRTDYEGITKALLAESVIEEGMPREVIGQQIAELCLDELVVLAAGGRQIVEARDFESLVVDVSPISAVREAVEIGFQDRVRQVRDSGNYDVLAVNGRNLGPAIESVEATRLLLRTFMSVHPIEAGLRECEKNNIDPHSSEGQKIFADTIKRSKADPVRLDKDALIFEHDPGLRQDALRRYAMRMFNGDISRARDAMYGTLHRPPRSDVYPRAIGHVAALTGRQISFDTTAFKGYGGYADPKQKMLEEIDRMLDDALEVAATQD